MRRFRLLVVTVFAAFGVVAPAEGADYFLEINGIPGESRDGKLPNRVDVLAYTWGGTRAPTTGGTGAARPVMKELTISKRVDVASTSLFRRLVQATTISSMELLGRKGGTSPVIFMRYCFQNVQVTSIDHSDSTGGDGPLENVSFFYQAVSEQYSRQNADGSVAQTVFAGWNATTGTLITAYPTACG